MFLQKSSLVDVWLVSKYASGFRNSHRCSVEKAVLKHFAIFTGNTCVGVSFQQSCKSSSRIRIECEYLSVFTLNARKQLNKKLWLLSFFMAVATYCYYEKVRRMMCTTIVLYLFNIYIYTFKMKSNWKHFKSLRMAPKHQNLYFL